MKKQERYFRLSKRNRERGSIYLLANPVAPGVPVDAVSILADGAADLGA